MDRWLAKNAVPSGGGSKAERHSTRSGKSFALKSVKTHQLLRGSWTDVRARPHEDFSGLGVYVSLEVNDVWRIYAATFPHWPNVSVIVQSTC